MAYRVGLPISCEFPKQEGANLNQGVVELLMLLIVWAAGAYRPFVFLFVQFWPSGQPGERVWSSGCAGKVFARGSDIVRACG